MKAYATELAESVTELTRHYAIWHELVNAQERKQREAAVSEFSDFFASTALSHFMSFCTLTYQLYDTRKDVKSIVKILRELKRKDESLAASLEQEVESHSELIAKIRDIRSNVFAHRAKMLTPEEVYSRVNLTTNMLGEIIGLAQDQTGRILDAFGVDTYHEFIDEVNNREFCAREDVQRLFHVLQGAV